MPKIRYYCRACRQAFELAMEYPSDQSTPEEDAAILKQVNADHPQHTGEKIVIIAAYQPILAQSLTEHNQLIAEHNVHVLAHPEEIISDLWRQFAYSSCAGLDSGGLSVLEDVEEYLLLKGLIDENGNIKNEQNEEKEPTSSK